MKEKNMSKSVRIGDLYIGGGRPVTIQSMTNVDSRDENALMEQIARLTDAGCEIVRIAVPDMEAADTLGVVYGYCPPSRAGAEGAVGTSRPHSAPYPRPARPALATDATTGVGCRLPLALCRVVTTSVGTSCVSWQGE